ncbi:MAG: type II toxin-antitoxin system RelE/ParE family toxin [Gammaproteobacteria bacterium]|nr:type II toxin-antitoxin system RelE/ParE family toxin [Gammaproteobacteria bacterium]
MQWRHGDPHDRDVCNRLDELRDFARSSRVQARIERLAGGNAGDMKPVGEACPKCGSTTDRGYRVYFTRQKRELIVLLAGGDKSTQAADIKTALRLAREL